MRTKSIRKTIVTLGLALALTGALTACGKDDDKKSDTTTAAATEAKTEAKTEKPTEAATEKGSEKPTEAATEKGSEKPTEAETEKATEAEQKETEAEATESEVLEDSFVGNYYNEENERVTMTITKEDGSELYDVKVRWGDSANTTYVYTFSGSFDGNVMEYSNCIKTKECIDESGNYIEDEDGNPTPLAIFKYGTGTMSAGNGGIQWTEDNEHQLDGTFFRRY